MMISLSPPQKRRLPHVPTPHELARVFKRPRHSLDQDLSGLANTPDSLLAHSLSASYPQGSRNYPPVLHSIPQDAFPILKKPYQVSDFFSDVAPKSPQALRQHLMSARTFPPPMPPPPSFLNMSDDEGSGVMVPFVYPPLPAFEYDPWTVYPGGSRERNTGQSAPNHATDSKAEQAHNRPKRSSAEGLSKPLENPLQRRAAGSEARGVPTHPVIAPLPFPPPNFMPYPIIAENAPLTPHEVFSSWIEASKHLPRVDMVLASAAGSIYDFHSQASAEGLDTSKIDELLRIANLDSDGDLRTHSFDDEDSPIANYFSYASNVDTCTVEDPYAKPLSDNCLVVQSDSRIRALDVVQHTSKDGVEFTEGVASEGTAAVTSNAIEDQTLLPVEVPCFEFTNTKDLIMPNGMQKGRRRRELAKVVTDLEEHEQTHRAEIYAQKKQQLLARLQSLQSCKVTFDNDPSQMADAELRDFAEKRQTQRDEELIRLKATYNYEKLKNVLNFYQTSHRLYKAMNATMVNKLEKLRNFLEHQRQVLDTAVKSVDSDAKNMRSKESEKLYSGFVEQEYGNEIKEEFRLVMARDEGIPLDQNKAFDASLFTKIYKGHEHSATVEDYMPLVTKEEFKLITGDAPAKTVNKDAGNKGKSARHQIFQSMLYDRATSGSDTDTPTLKRRPGRRAAPKPTYGDEAKVSNDAALVAKIMKQFVGPGPANAEELVHDLDSIGIQTKWPVK